MQYLSLSFATSTRYILNSKNEPFSSCLAFVHFAIALHLFRLTRWWSDIVKQYYDVKRTFSIFKKAGEIMLNIYIA